METHDTDSELDFFPFGTPAANDPALAVTAASVSTRGAGPNGSNRDDAAVAERDNRRVLRAHRPSRSKVA